MDAVTEDGWRLRLKRFAPPAGASGVGAVLAAHAMMARGRTLERMAARLAAAGLEVFVLDFRGHGGSAPPTARERDWWFDDYVRYDLPAARAAAAAAAQVREGALGYLGHSLGGLVSLAAGAPFLRQVLITTNLWRFGSGARTSWQRRVVLRAWVGSARLFGYAPARALRLGTDDEPRGYVTQMGQWARSGQWRSRDGAIDYWTRLREVRAPTLSLVAAGDRLCTRRDAAELLEPLGTAEKGLEVVGRRSGLPFDPDHFGIVRDPRAQPVWDRIARFLGG